MSDTYPFTSALVTGASSGIGEALVHRLGGAGIPQVVVARRVDRLESLAAQYPSVEVLAADLSTAKGVAAVVERILDPSRPIDLVVNNAGFGTSGDFHTLTTRSPTSPISTSSGLRIFFISLPIGKNSSRDMGMKPQLRSTPLRRLPKRAPRPLEIFHVDGTNAHPVSL